MISEPAPAKVNLALHVRRRRADGYHDIETLFAFCADGDVVTVAEAERDRLDIIGPFARVLASSAPHVVAGDPLQEANDGPRQGRAERDGDNLVLRAADAFRDAFAIRAGHHLTLEKNLPVASGIGGGSADAAATLRALARLHGIDQDDARLVAIARALGADVPACLAGQAAFGTGRGDALVPVAGWAGAPVLLVNPRMALSTAAVFAAWDGTDRGPLDPADPTAGRNDLEAPARALAPEIDGVLAMLAAQPGTSLVRMSGSGATCFALFAKRAMCDAAAEEIASRRPEWWQLPTYLS